MLDVKETRARLREWRKSHDLTLGQFAQRCGIKSLSLVCEWERGGRSPSYGNALAIERATRREIRVEEWGFDRKTARRAEAA